MRMPYVRPGENGAWPASHTAVPHVIEWPDRKVLLGPICRPPGPPSISDARNAPGSDATSSVTPTNSDCVAVNVCTNSRPAGPHTQPSGS
jgi:hypothetical protein